MKIFDLLNLFSRIIFVNYFNLKGGIYESDDFYDLADEYGILLWHDFMFACSMYKANQDDLDNVREEIKHQVAFYAD